MSTPADIQAVMKLDREQDQKLKRFIVISAAAHIGLMIFLFLKSVIAPSTPKEYIPSLRVDLVALPNRKMNDPVVPAPTAAEPEPKKEEAATKPDPKLQVKPEEDKGEMSVAKKKKQKSKKEVAAQEKMKAALARIKAIERIKAMSEPVRGNQISKGSAITGEAKIALETSYIDLVRERIITYWELPKWLKEQNLSANVQVFIDRKGEMTRFVFVKPSGNEQFDNEVKRTLQASSPFPVPPAELASDLVSDGIIYRFPM